MADPNVCGIGNALFAEGISCAIDGRSVLQKFYLCAPRGALTLVLGGNGSGKSTLLRALYGLVPLTGGRISYRDTDVKTPSPTALARQGTVFLPQGRNLFFSFSRDENLRLRLALAARPPALAPVLPPLLKAFPALERLAGRSAAKLSGGERQQVAFAGAVLASPKVLLLDEPFTNLDQSARAGLQGILAGLVLQGCSVIVADQRPDELFGLACKVVVLKPALRTEEFVRVGQHWEPDRLDHVRSALASQ